jgi:glycosyltransferase involved in cell wall biosynthesis
MTIRIGILTERMLLGYGVDLVVDRQASLLFERGCDVTVFCLRNEIQEQKSYSLINVLNDPDFQLAGSMSRNALAFAKYFNSKEIDIWILSTPPFYDLCPLLDAPCLIVEYGTPPGFYFPPSVAENLDNSVRYRFKQVYGSLRPCDMIVSISNSIRDWLPAGVRHKSELIYLGCDHYKPASAEQRYSFRKRIGVGDDDIVVLWVGRIQTSKDEQPYKGLLEFIQIAENLKIDNPRIVPVAAGRGEAEDGAVLKSKGIIPVLNLPDCDMASAYAASDVFVSTSKWEGFNLPLLEAQSQGTPVVAYKFGPHREVVQDRITGLLCSSSEELRAAVLTLIDDPERRTAIGKNAKAFAQGFSWKASVDRLYQLVEKTLQVEHSGRKRIRSARADNIFVAKDTLIRYGPSGFTRRVFASCAARIRRLLR